MPLFPNVGKRIERELLRLGYRQPNGKPDVRRFCWKYAAGTRTTSETPSESPIIEAD
jgi:hypothetical protein